MRIHTALSKTLCILIQVNEKKIISHYLIQLKISSFFVEIELDEIFQRYYPFDDVMAAANRLSNVSVKK